MFNVLKILNQRLIFIESVHEFCLSISFKFNKHTEKFSKSEFGDFLQVWNEKGLKQNFKNHDNRLS